MFFLSKMCNRAMQKISKVLLVSFEHDHTDVVNPPKVLSMCKLIRGWLHDYVTL